MKVKNRRTGDLVRGTLSRREGRTVIVLEDGQIADALDYKIVEYGGSSKEEQFAIREWLRRHPNSLDRGNGDEGEEDEGEY